MVWSALSNKEIDDVFYGPGLRRYVTEYIDKCIECQLYKQYNVKPSGFLQLPAYAMRMEVISSDFFSPLPKIDEGNSLMFINEDVSTRWYFILDYCLQHWSF